MPRHAPQKTKIFVLLVMFATLAVTVGCGGGRDNVAAQPATNAPAPAQNNAIGFRETYLYIAAGGGANAGGISAFHVYGTNAPVSAVSPVVRLPDITPGYLATSGQFVYATTVVSQGLLTAIHGFSADPQTGALRPISDTAVPAPGGNGDGKPGALFVDPAANNLYVSTDNFYCFHINPDGTLQLLSQPGFPDTQRQNFQFHGLIFSPDGNIVYGLGSIGSPKGPVPPRSPVYLLIKDSQSGALQIDHEVLSDPYGAFFDPSGRNLVAYEYNFDHYEFHVYAVDRGSGNLALIQTFRARTQFRLLGWEFDSSGKYLYLLTSDYYGTVAVAVYGFDRDTGGLTLLGDRQLADNKIPALKVEASLLLVLNDASTSSAQAVKITSLPRDPTTGAIGSSGSALIYPGLGLREFQTIRFCGGLVRTTC